MSAPVRPPASTPDPSPPPSSRPSHRVALAIGAVGMLLLIGLVVAVSLVERHPRVPGEEAAADRMAVGHIHGIGVDPDDGRLYIGAHLGVFIVGPDGDVRPVGTERHDTMGFTIAGPNEFLASGHPDLTSDRPPHLGLIQSDDAAETWSTVSLGGEADFHALETAEGRTWGADSIGARLLTSTDNQRWDTVVRANIIDVALDPTDPDRTLATDQTGQLRAFTAAGLEQDVPDAPTLAYLDWPTRDELLGVAPDGSVHVSRDQGTTWMTTGIVPGQPSAFEAHAQAWYAASDTGLYTSTDNGTTWTPLFEYDHAP